MLHPCQQRLTLNNGTYDPLNGLAAEFRRENLRVTLVANVRSDLGSVHMIGPVVEVVSMSER